MSRKEIKAQRIKEAREKANLSKAEVARRLGMPYTTYDSYESGYREPGIDVIVKIAVALGIDALKLLDDANEKEILAALLIPPVINSGRSLEEQVEALKRTEFVVSIYEGLYTFLSALKNTGYIEKDYCAEPPMTQGEVAHLCNVFSAYLGAIELLNDEER